MQAEEILALDVGGKRIGVARANTIARIPEQLDTIIVDGTEVNQIIALAKGSDVRKLVVGLPRNQSGDETKQTQAVKEFVAQFDKEFEVIWQDESLTSVAAEEQLMQSGKSFKKGDIDSLAAVQILKDYLDRI